MSETLFITIPESYAGERVDSVLADLLRDYSRSKITTFIKKGWIKQADKIVKPKDKVIGGEVLSVCITQTESTPWIAEDIALDVVYEDDDIIVINKPAGLVTHPGAGNQSQTLANALLHFDSRLSNLDRAGLVHRLDKNTSGLLVVARNEKAQYSLIKQLQQHRVQRHYVALVYGRMIAGATLDFAIGRDSKDRTKQAVKAGGKAALTHIRLIERFHHHSYVKAVLETGRTHQIRVHLSHAGYPLVGDVLYGGRVRFPKKADAALKTALTGFKRQALHAKKLTLLHPSSGQSLSWKAPIPSDLQQLLSVLRQYDAEVFDGDEY